MNGKQELQAAIEAAEIAIVERAIKFTLEEEGRSFAATGNQLSWKEYVKCFDKHLSTELILTKVIF